MNPTQIQEPLTQQKQAHQRTHEAMGSDASQAPDQPDNTLSPIPARLLADTFAEESSLGFRITALASRQVLYQAGDHRICLSIDYQEPKQAIDIMGQSMCLGPDPTEDADADVKLLKEEEVVGATKSNEFGVFLLEDTPEGIYDLKIKSKKEEIDIIGLNAVVSPQQDRES